MRNETNVTTSCSDDTRLSLSLIDTVALVFLPIMTCVGMTGNVLVMLVYKRSRVLTGHAGNLTFVTICLLDTLTLLFGVVWQALRLHIKYYGRICGVQERYRSPQYIIYMTCLYLLEPWMMAASTWTECYLSVARFCAMYWPHRSKTFFTYDTTKKFIFGILLAAFSSRVPFWIVALRPLNIQETIREKMSLAEPLVVFVLRLFLPSLILTVTTVGIIRVLKRSRERFASIPRRDISDRPASIPASPRLNDAANNDYSNRCQSTLRLVTVTTDKRMRIEGRLLAQKSNSNSGSGCAADLGSPWNFNLVRITFVLIGKNLSYILFLMTYIVIDLWYLWYWVSVTGSRRPGALINAYTLAYLFAYLHHCSNLFICIVGGKRFRLEATRFSCCSKFKFPSDSQANRISLKGIRRSRVSDPLR